MLKTVRHSLALLLASTIACSGVLFALPRTANAATVADSIALSAKVEECTTRYHEAQDRVDELTVQIADNESRIEEIEGKLPEQREKAAASLRTLYKFHQSNNGLLDLVLSSDDFEQFIATIQYLDIIQNRNFEEINRLVQMQDELRIARTSLDVQREEATEQLAEALDALNDAEAARDEARRLAQEIAEREEEERRKRAEEDPTPADDPKEEDDPASPEENDPEEPKPSDPEPDNPEPADPEPSDPEPDPEPADPEPEPEPEPTPEPSTPSNPRDEFISVWSARIDAYNAGTPLGGYGYAFAAAAYDYGVDPRFSPAIAFVESSQGFVCFEPYNAWGWFADVAWYDWETAIWGHVGGLAAGYGYTLTWEGAAMYCPPGDAWYYAVAGQMAAIWPTDTL